MKKVTKKSLEEYVNTLVSLKKQLYKEYNLKLNGQDYIEDMRGINLNKYIPESLNFNIETGKLSNNETDDSYNLSFRYGYKYCHDYLKYSYNTKEELINNLQEVLNIELDTIFNDINRKKFSYKKVNSIKLKTIIDELEEERLYYLDSKKGDFTVFKDEVDRAMKLIKNSLNEYKQLYTNRTIKNIYLYLKELEIMRVNKKDILYTSDPSSNYQKVKKSVKNNLVEETNLLKNDLKK